MSGRDFTEAQMKRYFSKDSSLNFAIALCIIGIILVIFGLAVNPLHFAIASLIGLLLLMIGGGTAVVENRMLKPTDKEYDEWLEEQANAMIPKALEKFHLEESLISGRPLIVHSFVLPGTPDADRYRGEFRWKKGKDGAWRFSINVYTFFFPTERYLAVFTTTIDALHQSTHIYLNATYHYPDIVSVESSNFHSTVDFDGEKTEYLLETFSLKLISGGSIGIGAAFSAIPVDKRQKTPSFTISGTNVDQTVANLRLLIDSKKSMGI